MPGEANREDAHDGVELVVEAYGLSEHLAPAEEMALPKKVAQDGDIFDFRFIAGVFCGEGSAEKRGDAEEFKGVRGEELLVDGFRDALFGERDTAAVGEDDVFDRLRAGFHLLVLAHGVGGVAAVFVFGIEDVGHADAVGARVRVGID